MTTLAPSVDGIGSTVAISVARRSARWRWGFVWRNEYEGGVPLVPGDAVGVDAAGVGASDGAVVHVDDKGIRIRRRGPDMVAARCGGGERIQ